MAEPSQYLIYATAGDYEIDTPANSVRKVMLCISMVAVFVLSILLLGIVYQVIRGFRTGDFFTRKSVVMVRVMAVVYCLGSLIWSNWGALEASVASEFCGALCPEGMGGAYVLNTDSIVIPLVMLVVAELMNIARMLNELSERIDISVVNLSKLKTGKVRAIRFSTLDAICRALDCQTGDILEFRPDTPEPKEK